MGDFHTIHHTQLRLTSCFAATKVTSIAAYSLTWLDFGDMTSFTAISSLWVRHAVSAGYDTWQAVRQGRKLDILAFCRINNGNLINKCIDICIYIVIDSIFCGSYFFFFFFFRSIFPWVEMFLINWFDRSKYQFVSCAGLGAVMDEFDLRVEDLNAKAGGLRLCW